MLRLLFSEISNERSDVTRCSNVRNSSPTEDDSICKVVSFSFPVATNTSFALGNIIISVLPCPYLFPTIIRNIISPFFGTACLHRRLKWYYDQKSPYLFFLHFESTNYKYLPCQILGHDFDEKSDFLNYEFSIRLPAITQTIQKWPSSKERWIEGGRDVIQSRHLNKRGYFSMQKRSARFMFYLSSCVFCLRLAWKRLCRLVVALFDWMTSHPPSTHLSPLN